MAQITKTQIVDILQDIYADGGLEKLVYNKLHRPLVTRIAHEGNQAGNTYNYGVETTFAGKGSASFTVAQDGSRSYAPKQFKIDPDKKYYRVAQIETLAARAGASNAKAFANTLESHMDSKIQGVSNDLEMFAFRGNDKSAAVVASTANLSSTTLKLSNPEDALLFQEGDAIVFAEDNTSALRSATAIAVSNSDEEVGTLTLAVTPASVSGTIAVGDVIFKEGDYADASDRNGVYALPTWAGTETIGGVTRTGNKRLQLINTTGSLSNILGAVRSAMLTVYKRGPEVPNACYLSIDNVDQALEELKSHDYSMRGEKRTVEGHEKIFVLSPVGEVELVPAVFCRNSELYLLAEKKMKWISTGPALVDLLDDDGNEFLRAGTADALECRVAAMGVELVCHAPNSCALVTLS